MVRKLKSPLPSVSPVVLYDVFCVSCGGVIQGVQNVCPCPDLCPDGYKAQFLRYLDENFMEGVFQYYLEVLFLVFEKNFKKEKKFQKKP